MKILIAEDDTTSRLLLTATLKKLGHEVTAARNGEEAWQAMGAGEFSLLISDWMMPGVDGLELCRRIRGRGAEHANHYTYIILLTSLVGKGSFLTGMEAGADDFITKPFDGDQLEARLRVAGRILDLHEALRTQAMYDGLTGLLNRTAITERLCYELDRSAREGRAASVILLDVDHFKQINDTYGHATGDDVLREVAKRLKRAMRGYDTVGRYGGEEFLVVAPGCAQGDSLTLAERLRRSLSDAPISTPKGSLQLTASLGVAATGAANEKWEGMIARADAALYRAKAGGRNRVELARVGADLPAKPPMLALPR